MKIVYIVHAFVNMYKITGEEIECHFYIAYNVHIALSIKDRNRQVRNDHANFCLTSYIQHLFFLLRCFSIYFNSTNPDVKFRETRDLHFVGHKNHMHCQRCMHLCPLCNFKVA